jgi:hypothetical protein
MFAASRASPILSRNTLDGGGPFVNATRCRRFFNHAARRRLPRSPSSLFARRFIAFRAALRHLLTWVRRRVPIARLPGYTLDRQRFQVG